MNFGTARVKSLPTNVPESSLIDQIKQRPLLYDKNRREYRKSEESEAAWNEVSQVLGVSVVNCKKRWKSLRDTFIKYYRLEIVYNTQGSKRKQKPWAYFNELSFLRNHVELFRLEDHAESSNTREPQADPDSSKIIYLEETDEKEVYEIVDGANDERELLDIYEEKLEDDYDLDTQSKISPETGDEPKTHKLKPGNENTKNLNDLDSPNVRVITDPDEKYLMSCLPAFKRFNPQQKAYVRMAIEKLFYEVEFENVSEPKNKRLRSD